MRSEHKFSNEFFFPKKDEKIDTICLHMIVAEECFVLWESNSCGQWIARMSPRVTWADTCSRCCRSDRRSSRPESTPSSSIRTFAGRRSRTDARGRAGRWATPPSRSGARSCLCKCTAGEAGRPRDELPWSRSSRCLSRAFRWKAMLYFWKKIKLATIKYLMFIYSKLCNMIYRKYSERAARMILCTRNSTPSTTRVTSQ